MRRSGTEKREYFAAEGRIAASSGLSKMLLDEIIANGNLHFPLF
jgi:hypothetical protein